MSSRRSFLRLSALGAIGLLAACRPAPSAPAASGAPPATVAPVVPNQATAAPVTTSAPAAQATPTAATGGTPKRGGQLTILQTNDFVSMDPIYASGPTAAACYDWLVAWRPGADGQYAVQPQLAKAWEASDTKIVFHLRDDVKFH
ncbi:MAG: hypothetical protein JOZ81_18545, partial [Chloroflexi bacterium]|nr:hypothetical protein [Chloroflexota bacterium]